MNSRRFSKNHKISAGQINSPMSEAAIYWPPMSHANKKNRQMVNRSTCIYLALIATLVIVLKGADCATNPTHHASGQHQSAESVTKTVATNQAGRSKIRRTSQRPRASSLPAAWWAPGGSRSATDQLALAQQQARLMAVYNNTPPLFVTDTRDLFVDVARQPLGAPIKRIEAIDVEGDQLEYSLRPAPTTLKARDASPHFAINSSTGQLKLAHRPFNFQSKHLKGGDTCDGTDGMDCAETLANQEGSSEEGEEESEDNDEDHDQTITADRTDPQRGAAAADQNLYFLNVAADDGRYTSIVELQIHVLNSSAIMAEREVVATLQKRPSKPIRHQQASPIKIESSSQASIVDASTTIGTENGQQLGLRQDISSHHHHIQQQRQQQQAGQQDIPPPPLSTNQWPQSMIVCLVVVCSVLIIVLVLLLFIVPLSVKRLRRRLKYVESRQKLEAQQSNSSTISSPSSSDHSHSHHHHHHGPSLSQFTLSSSSDRSQIMGPRVEGIGSGSSSLYSSATDNIVAATANGLPQLPADYPLCYLQQQQSQFHRQQQQMDAFAIRQATCYRTQPALIASVVDSGVAAENLYYPIDNDEFYSTITTTGNHIMNVSGSSNSPLGAAVVNRRQNLHQDNTFDGNLFIGKVNDGAERKSPSLSSESSGSSTRSLARFLSLPARHFQQPIVTFDNEELGNNTANNLAALLNDNCPIFATPNKQPQVVQSKTIARSNNLSAKEITGDTTNWELERHRLTWGVMLDEGQFGLVFRCKLKKDDGTEQTVAVKTLKKSSLKDDLGRLELLAEIEIMKLVCRHPNVVKILHCCTFPSAQSSELLIMEYVEFGKLQSYLEKSRLTHQYATNHNDSLYSGRESAHQPEEIVGDNLNNHNHQLTSRDLVKFIYHVAKGMEYISSQCIVHRDLASRNILVSAHRICKIGDFGMARHMQSASEIYERHSQNTKVPVRWMAPEVLLNNSFTTKSDVFSFGILMWEIVTLGSTPYRHLATQQVIEAVARNGERPQRPDYCHKQLYEIMSKCWLHKPGNRPTFRCLVKQLDKLVLSANDYIELNQYPDHDYYNIPESAAPYELL